MYRRRLNQAIPSNRFGQIQLGRVELVSSRKLMRSYDEAQHIRRWIKSYYLGVCCKLKHDLIIWKLACRDWWCSADILCVTVVAGSHSEVCAQLCLMLSAEERYLTGNQFMQSSCGNPQISKLGRSIRARGRGCISTSCATGIVGYRLAL